GGAGNNAVNRMIDEEIANVDFWVANTDKQALSTSRSMHRLILGQEITGGLGAGGEPEIGEKAAEASAEDIKQIVKNANMVFVAAGMGGGTGTGAAPVVARIAKDAGALVIAIVTRPFTFEGKKRVVNSISGLNRLKQNVDSIIVVNNDKLLMTSGNSSISSAFNESDKVLAQSVKTVVNLILLPAVINLDFADVRNTLKGSGVAMIGFGVGTGPNRAKDAAAAALNSPLLETSISGARRAIVAVTCGRNVSLFDAQDTVNLLINASGHDVDVKFGVAINDQLNDEILVSVIAGDFEDEIDFSQPSDFTPPSRDTVDSVVPTPIVDSDEGEQGDEINKTSILPEFLKD
ncbi:MAG: cell division protein FtsZ, partial [Erysipelotrichia bacterium]|nr:cell division protein FtsZ [Erysipelotrichia bacterium]